MSRLTRSNSLVLSALAVAALLQSPALAEWQYQEHESEFDGKKSIGLYALSETGEEVLIVWAHPDTGHIAMQGPRIVLKPNLPYICNTSESELETVDYVTFDNKGNKRLQGQAKFDVDTARTYLSVRNAENPDYNFGPALLKAMNDADEIRFRFTDDCGNQSISKFKMDGFKRVASDIGYDYY